MKKEIWLGSGIHVIISTIIVIPILKLVTYIGLKHLDLDFNQMLFIGFALSFSSTVLALKALEDKGDTESLYGKTAIGILIMQDVFAIIYLVLSQGTYPDPKALLLLGIIAFRPIVYWIFDRVGHGELLVLFGLSMAFIFGAGLFSALGIKADLGALLMGVMLSYHKKADELAKSLFHFKELFLVAFFLSIGLGGLPSQVDLLIAAGLSLFIFIKLILFVLLLTRFRLRARTSLFTACNLSNYSEFGLILVAIAVNNETLPKEWLIIVAIALSFSFLIAAPLNVFVGNIYKKIQDYIVPLERYPLHVDDRPINLGNPKFLILGMGRIGSGAYDCLKERYGDEILGVEHKKDLVDFHILEGRNVVQGDATDVEFWDKIDSAKQLELVLLAIPHNVNNIFVVNQLKQRNYQGKISAVVQFREDRLALEELGVDSTYNMYEVAGAGFVEQVIDDLLADKVNEVVN